jgi:hypothetical protein
MRRPAREYEQARPEQCEVDQAHQLDATLGPARVDACNLCCKRKRIT